MINSSLEKLVKILPDAHVDIMKASFRSVTETNAHLFNQKGCYPYSNASYLTKISEEYVLLSEWRNTLEGGILVVSEVSLGHANQMWKLLECKTLKDYQDSSPEFDCVLLACVW